LREASLFGVFFYVECHFLQTIKITGLGATMLNQYPAWKYFLLLIALGISVVFSLPNLYPDDYAVQVTTSQISLEVGTELEKNIVKLLDEAKIDSTRLEFIDRNILIRFEDSESQLAAQDALKNGLGSDYVAALNMAASTPEWLRSFGAGPMKLGLDLRGGVHFLLEVDMEKA
jgi:preprotein translocase subunit SecD